LAVNSDIQITVVPCEITAASVPDMSVVPTESNKPVSAHPEFTYTNTESNPTHCGSIAYELVDGNTSYLTYDTTTREFSLTHLVATEGIHIHKIRGKCSGFPLNTVEATFKVLVGPPCSITAFALNRLDIKAQPDLEKY
jgi:hypothetical protein